MSCLFDMVCVYVNKKNQSCNLIPNRLRLSGITWLHYLFFSSCLAHLKTQVSHKKNFNIWYTRLPIELNQGCFVCFFLVLYISRLKLAIKNKFNISSTKLPLELKIRRLISDLLHQRPEILCHVRNLVIWSYFLPFIT